MRPWLDIARILLILPRIERGRLLEGPAPLIASLRRKGRRSRTRTDLERCRLRTAIGWIDRLFPDGGNCYRRVLLEVALDGRAAAEPLVLGLSGTGEPLSGHAWLGNGHDGEKPYDAVISL